MATTRLELRDRASNYLCDLNGLYSTAELDGWLDEGLRRMAPVVLQDVVGSITINSALSHDLVDTIVYMLRVYADDGSELPPWRQFGTVLIFETAPTYAGSGTVEYFGSWPPMGALDNSVCPLADFQTDALVFYVVARAFRQLAINRSDYRKYSTVVNNRVDLAELQQLAVDWEAEFEKARAEARTHRQIMYEMQRQGGSTPRAE